MSTTFSNRSSRAAFTIVELMVGIVASMVLLLSVGSILMYGYRGWARLQRTVDLQRDMRAAMEVLNRMPRASTNMSFSTGLVFQVQFADRPAAQVYATGGSLFYNPNVSGGAGATRLANGFVRQFDVTIQTNLAHIVLVLTNGQDFVSNSVSVFRRN